QRARAPDIDKGSEVERSFPQVRDPLAGVLGEVPVAQLSAERQRDRGPEELVEQEHLAPRREDAYSLGGIARPQSELDAQWIVWPARLDAHPGDLQLQVDATSESDRGDALHPELGQSLGHIDHVAFPIDLDRELVETLSLGPHIERPAPIAD